jgi:hypothetical protein
MNNVNYIHHLNGILVKFSKDERLNPSHISLYLALFYYWNLSRFANKFYIDRAEVMHLARIGSKKTYHKDIHDLNNWKYLKYFPSFNPYKGSQIHLYNFGTSREQAVVRYHTNIETSREQAVARNINIYKHDKHVNINIYKREILNFFKKNNWPKKQAEKFFNHYEAVGWKKGNSPIENWQAAAENWMIKAEEIMSSRAESRGKKRKTAKAPVQNWDNLHTNNDKNYDEPL